MGDTKAMTETLYPTCCNSHCNMVYDKNPKKATDLCCYLLDQQVGNGSVPNEEPTKDHDNTEQPGSD